MTKDTEIIRVLLVEDDPDDARLVSARLTKTKANQVAITHSEDLAKALELLGKQTFDVILLDLGLPDSEGLETVLRVNHHWAAVPIIVLTAADDTEMVAAAVMAGAVDYLIKGRWDTAQLVSSIHVAKQGRRIPSPAGTRITNNSTQAVTVASSVTDITLHKQVEELRIRLLQIEDERNHLSSALQAFEQVLGVVGHELRTPLAAVRATAELLLDDEAQDAAGSSVFVKNIHGEVVRMAHLVDDLVEVARLNSGVARWNWSEFGVCQICEEALSTLSLITSQDKVGLVLKVDPTDLVMRGDSGAIRRLVVNLLNNAYKHTPEGSVSVLASNLSIGGLDWVQIVVSDTGHGMSPEVAARLGEAFALNSGVVGENHVQGSGLGLAICRGIVAAHGGTISVNTALEKGTSVTVLLRADLSEPTVVAQAANIVCEVQQ